MADLSDETRGAEDEFDLRPDPRVLPMLGEINLEQWRCLGELIDNAVDGFLNAGRVGEPIQDARVDVILPVADMEGAQVRIIDNGMGMTPEVLQKAVSAGWSGNNPIDNLGLFGMGFNIATARLGSVTEVWSTRRGDPEWHGMEIDFDRLRRQRHFRTAHLRRPKAEPDQHGTEVTVKRLKVEQRRWLARAANQTSLRKRLSQTYSSMLRQNGIPISFNLLINNKRVIPFNHCVWGEERSVTLSDVGLVPAVFHFDYKLAKRVYCSYCMNWLNTEASTEEPCPVCASCRTVINRDRRVKGWLGIQRYLDKTEFGVDFLRNGRKIEIHNKDLFVWRDGEVEEPEYPIDDQRNRGRIVGEVHVDHCRVSYAKDRFDRTDPSWEEMIKLLRGEGPLRPDKARNLGYPENDAPLFKLFKAFRRTSPHNKVAGAWRRIMIIKDNERAAEMATYFHEGQPDYQDDSKWWELIEEAERELLYGGSPKGGKEGEGCDGNDDLPEGLLDDEDGNQGEAQSGSVTGADPAPAPPRRRDIPSLSRKYVHQATGVSWNVKAFEVEANDPDLSAGAPWAFPLADVATRTYHYLVHPSHRIFSSLTMTPRDALLAEMAWMTVESLRMSRQVPTFAAILSDFRGDYAEDTMLDPRQMGVDASEILADIARAVARNCPEADRPALFNDLSVGEQQAVMRTLARRKIRPTEVTNNGSFLQYAPYEHLQAVVEKYPEYCFDGKIWDEPYEDLDYGDADVTEGARASIRARYAGLIGDAIRLARQEAGGLIVESREEIVRALMSLRLLKPDVEVPS